jgi:hypothetical protein
MFIYIPKIINTVHIVYLIQIICGRDLAEFGDET